MLRLHQRWMRCARCAASLASVRRKVSERKWLGYATGAASAAIASAVASRRTTSSHPGLQCAEGPASSRAKIVVFGDSITQIGFAAGGWVQRLADIYSRRADIINRGYSGYNTRWAKLALEQLLAGGMDTDIVLWTVFLGANDAAMPDSHRQHVPLAEYENNLKDMLRRIQSASPTQTRIIVITPPPVDEGKLLAFQRLRNPSQVAPDRTDATAGSYAAAARRAAAACEVELLDLYESMHAQEQPAGHYLSDGLHLSEAGGELVCNLLIALIAERLPWLAVHPCRFTGAYHNSGSSSALRQEFPWHDQLVVEPPHHAMFAKLS